MDGRVTLAGWHTRSALLPALPTNLLGILKKMQVLTQGRLGRAELMVQMMWLFQGHMLRTKA